MWKFWLVLSGIFLVIEIVNLGFFIFWFSVGALLTMILSFFVDSVTIQAIFFMVVSTVLLFATKPLVNKILPKEPAVKTNASSLEGKTAKVTIDIEPEEGKGQIKIDGETWSAKSENNVYIPKDSLVVIEKIEGVKVIVKPLEK